MMGHGKTLWRCALAGGLLLCLTTCAQTEAPTSDLVVANTTEGFVQHDTHLEITQAGTYDIAMAEGIAITEDYLHITTDGNVTLNLTDVHIDTSYIMAVQNKDYANLTLCFAGENELASSTYAIYTNAPLVMAGEQATVQITAGISGIYAEDTLDLTQGIAVDVAATSRSDTVAAIYTEGNLTLTDATITNATASMANAISAGILSEGDITLQNATVQLAQGGAVNSTYGTSAGVYTYGSLLVQDSTLTAVATADAQVGGTMHIGVYCEQDFAATQDSRIIATVTGTPYAESNLHAGVVASTVAVADSYLAAGSNGSSIDTMVVAIMSQQPFCPTGVAVFSSACEGTAFTPITEVCSQSVGYTWEGQEICQTYARNNMLYAAIVCDPDIAPTTSYYDDVSMQNWYCLAVNTVTELGWMNGVADRIFDGEAQFTRAMLAQLLYNIQAPEGAESNARPFTDVPEEAWYTNAIGWCATQGLVDGMGDGTYLPNQAITMEQMMQVLYNYAKLIGVPTTQQGDLTQLGENQPSWWAEDVVIWALGANLLDGMVGDRIPQQSLTRAQVATMLANYANLLG